MLQKLKNICFTNSEFIQNGIENYLNAFKKNELTEKDFEIFMYIEDVKKEHVKILFNTIDISGKYKNLIIHKCFNHFIFLYEYFLLYNLDTRDHIIFLIENDELKLLVDRYLYDFTNDELLEILRKNINYKTNEITERLTTLQSEFKYDVCEIINDKNTLKILSNKNLITRDIIFKLNYIQLDWLEKCNIQIPKYEEFINEKCDESIISWYYGKYYNTFTKYYNPITYSNILNSMIYQNYLNDLQISENLFGLNNNEYEGFDDEECNNKILNYLKNPPKCPIIEYEILIREHEKIFEIYNIKIKNFIKEKIVDEVIIGERYSLKI